MAWEREQTSAKVLELAYSIVGGEPLTAETGLRGRGITDVQLVYLALLLEETFEVDADDQQFAPAGTETSAAAIAAFIWAKVDAKQKEEAERKAKKK